MTGYLQNTILRADFRRSRHIIREKQMQYIRRRKRMFHRIFVTEFKKRLRRMIQEPWTWNRYNRKRYRVWSDDTLNRIGKEIHEYFGYSPRTNVDDVLMSFRRLYLRMYPQERDR